MSKNSKSNLYSDLKRFILTMDLLPEEDLDETTLGETYGLSRTPVREVLQRLAGEGYINLRENKGARVSPLSHDTLRSFFLVAPLIYAAVGRLAVQNFRRAQLTDLEKTQARFRHASQNGDPSAMTLENVRFHEIIGEMSANAYLQASLGRLLIDHARIGRTFFNPRDIDMHHRFKVSVDHHDLFIAAIRERDEDALVDLIFDHWELSRENMELYVMPSEMKAEANKDGFWHSLADKTR